MKVKIMETYTENENAITITITGKPLENLRKIAAAMNETDWCDDDNTPSSILDSFIVGSLFSDLGTPVEKERHYCGDVGEIVELILGGIDTGHPDESPESETKLAALRAAFVRHGVCA